MTKACQCHNRFLPQDMKNSSDEIVAGPGPAGMAGHRDRGTGESEWTGRVTAGPGAVAPERPTLWTPIPRMPASTPMRRPCRSRGGSGAGARAVAARPPLPVRRTPVTSGRPLPARRHPPPRGHRLPPGARSPGARPSPPGARPSPPGARPSPPGHALTARRTPSARHTPILARGGPAAGAARLLPGPGGRRHLAPGCLPGRLAALDPRRRRLRLGLLVGRPSAHPSRQPVGDRLPRGPGRHPARLPHPDAPAGCADDPGHAHLRAERVLQPAVHRLPRPAVLRHVPGSPAVAAHRVRGDRRRARSSACRPTSPGAAGTS